MYEKRQSLLPTNVLGPVDAPKRRRADRPSPARRSTVGVRQRLMGEGIAAPGVGIAVTGTLGRDAPTRRAWFCVSGDSGVLEWNSRDVAREVPESEHAPNVAVGIASRGGPKLP
jgi:hypothetical protein